MKHKVRVRIESTAATGSACVSINRTKRMSISMYAASVPVFTQMLGSLSALLRKAESHTEQRKIDADALLQARLFPDMFPLRRQVQISCDFARGVSARLAGVEVPSSPDTERSALRAVSKRDVTQAIGDKNDP